MPSSIHRAALLAALVPFALACSRRAGDAARSGDPAATAAMPAGDGAAASPAGDTSPPGRCDYQDMTSPTRLSPDERRPLTEGDVALYTRVMQGAVARWHDLPAADRKAMAAAHAVSEGGGGQSTQAMSANAPLLMRATQLMTNMDAEIVAEQHVDPSCYDVIRDRVERVITPGAVASGDAPAEGDGASPLPPAQRAVAEERMRLQARDSVFLAPYRARLQPLVQEIRMGHLQ